MIDPIDIFDIEQEGNISSPYTLIGYPRNPFRPEPDLDALDTGPFYKDHIIRQLRDITQWLREIHRDRTSSQTLSLVGTIGIGKTRLIRFIQRQITNWPSKEKALANLVLLSETGYARASVGGMIVSSLERMELKWIKAETPTGVLPLLWAIIISDEFPKGPLSPLHNALLNARNNSGEGRIDHARLISRWLQRSPLTESEAKRTGLYRRIDWEGEVIRITSDLFRLARNAGVLNTFFFFIDQLEDLFRPTSSELRRSRILTDLRGLVDEIDAGAPIGLLLSWTPDLQATATLQIGRNIELEFKQKYEALYSRLERRRINLPFLDRDDARPFANVWIEFLKKENDFDPNKQPDLNEIVNNAWTRLHNERKFFPGSGEQTTPRDLLTALADEVDLKVEDAERLQGI